MTRPGDDVTPERLAELADGASPRDPAERELMALMADVRELEEPTPDALRARVRAIASGEAPPARAHWWQEGRRRVLLVAAPVAAAVVVVAIAIPVLTSDSGDTAPPAATAEALAADSAAPTTAAVPEAAAAGAAAADAPGAARAVAPAAPQASNAAAARLRLKVADAAAANLAAGRAEAEIEAMGGSVVSESAGGGVRRLVVQVPGDRAAAALAALGRLGEVTGPPQPAPASADEVTIRVTITAGG